MSPKNIQLFEKYIQFLQMTGGYNEMISKYQVHLEMLKKSDTKNNV